MICELSNKIKNICNCEYKYFFNKGNVIGVGLGYKISNGVNTLTKCIKVFVKNKISKDKLNENEMIPKCYKGIPTDIVECGFATSCGFTKRIRPVYGGYSIGPGNALLNGTMGCVVKDHRYYYILGCNHVLADENIEKIGAAIIQPSKLDSGTPSHDTIAHLTKFIPIKFGSGEENYVDCAMARIDDKSLVTPEIVIIGSIKGTSDVKLGESVRKCGRTTEFTIGRISAINTTLNINFKKGKCLFKNQIATSIMSSKGDSGAILVDKNNYAVGLLVGDSITTSFFNPIKTVLSDLDVSIVTKL
ncbi:hypothetical protein ADU80_11390 [Clostridium botulinum]|uniref:Nal1 N-terminal domain-containing protein n=1 Tax=Clostridium botulinum TaxID=1491 RepID=A0A9Q1ZB98_CLOBO|nr:trypsin-like peptidase domain-containing protein [Clostridium botulinum]AEB77591.1 hypothetical protein CbC4_6070 [Clostridium botulinum BKT015925]KEH95987.1 hypothetical protein Y848_p0163 [Clostridium botulinum C/D str. Sp77]KOA77689.1 hypothetical protein ADU77_07360 [Clostridium botulinum]KOA80618.1 hypothetical protein ADU75_14300 [Clostridium botulinum]KOA83654.1 hypothetical protein ADU74_12025 [Clostridium botulinum]